MERKLGSCGKEDLISIIMPAYNAEKYIGKAIESVLYQTYSFFEFIVVDDGSTDNTAEIVMSYSDSRIRLIKHRGNLGVAEARNTALREASGKWCAAIDADDLWLPERLEKLTEIAGKDESCFVADDHMVFVERANRVKKIGSLLEFFHKMHFADDVCVMSFSDYVRYGAPLIHPVFPIRVVRENGLQYRREFVPAEDLDFHFQLFRRGLRLKITKNAYYLYRMNSGSLTAQEPTRSSSNVIRFQLTQAGLSKDERFFLARLLEKSRTNFIYSDFVYRLKRREIAKALRLIAENPLILLLVLVKLPVSARFRLRTFFGKVKAL